MGEGFNQQAWLTQIKAKPDDPQIWWEMAQAAYQAKDAKMACQGYLSVLRLDHQHPQAWGQYVEVRSIMHQQTLTENFRFDMFRLPKKSALFLLSGTMNMEIHDLENHIIGILQHNYRLIIFDCAGISTLSGLGPSFIRRMQQNATKVQGELVLLQANPSFQSILELKKIDIPNFSDLSTLFSSK